MTEKIRFTYEIELSEEVQDMYNELSEDTALPIIATSLVNVMKETEMDMERIISGYHSIWKHKGKEGLRKSVGLVNKLYELKIIDINHQGNEAIEKVKKQLSEI